MVNLPRNLLERSSRLQCQHLLVNTDIGHASAVLCSLCCLFFQELSSSDEYVQVGMNIYIYIYIYIYAYLRE